MKMKVGIYGQYYHEENKGYLSNLLSILHKKKAEIFFEENFLHLLKSKINLEDTFPVFNSFEDIDDSYQLFITLGGDGTILRAITIIRNLNIPILGINTGRLGFLATTQKERLEQTIENIYNDNYRISERNLISISTSPETEDIKNLNFALNEVAVSRRNTTSMISVETFINEEYLSTYWADGLIVSTPTGSTGYSLSCGGPVIAPESDNFVLTPIAPHNLNTRPLVIPSKSEIKLRVSSREKKYLISLDSRIIAVENNTEVYIKTAPFKIKLIQLHHESFLKTLRKKLHWGEDIRNNTINNKNQS